MSTSLRRNSGWAIVFVAIFFISPLKAIAAEEPIMRILIGNENKARFRADSLENIFVQGISSNHRKIKSLNLDKTGPMSAEKVLLAGPSSLRGFAASGDYGFGERLEGPTGASVFSAGKISEVALDRHMQNFSATKDAYTELKNQLSTGSVGSASYIGDDIMEVHYLSERCLIVQGANNFVLLKES